MKKTGLFTLLLTLLSLGSYAQITLIPKIGVSGNSFNTSEIVNEANNTTILKFNSVSGFTGGLGVQLPISPNGKFSLQPELLYIQKGYKMESADKDAGFINTETHNYLEVPLLARVSFGKKKIKSFVVLGPSASYFISGKYSNEMNVFGSKATSQGKIRFGEEPANYNGDDLYYSNEDVSRFDIGLQVGGGVGINVGLGTLQVEARYGIGFVDVFKDETTDVKNLSTQNRSFTLSLGYAIPIGR
jgi:hypothetical protein